MMLPSFARRWIRTAQPVLIALLLIQAAMSSVYAATAQEEAALELFNEGFQLFQSGNFESAQERFESGLRLAPKNTVALYYLGRVLEESGDARAMANYQAAFDSGPDTKEGILAKSRLDSMVAKIKKEKEEVNAEDENGDTPLVKAAQENDHETAALLIEKGAEVNPEGYPPLNVAIITNSYETAALLIEKGAKINEKLYLAKNDENYDIAVLLIEKGAEVNEKDFFDDTPLHRAAGVFSPSIMELLLIAGAEVNAKNKLGETPLARLYSSAASLKKNMKGIYKLSKKDIKEAAALLRKHGGKKK